MNCSKSATRGVAFVLIGFTAVLIARAADVRVYVEFAAGQKDAAIAAVEQQGGRTHHEFDDLNFVAASIPEQARAGLSRNPNIVRIEDDPLRRLLNHTVPTSPQTTPYGISMVQAPLALAAGATGAGIKVGVVDSGAFSTHLDFAGLALTGEPDYGAGDERTWYRDTLSHGTHVVGILAARNNGIGVLGVSPGPLNNPGGAVAIHMVKVFGDTGNFIYSSTVLAAAKAAVAKGARVINMSLGGESSSHAEQVGMDDLYYNQGVLLVAAAGNDGIATLNYPASYDSVISVGALDAAKTVADFSQRNAKVELSAPGVQVLSTVSYTDTTYIQIGATNYEARHVEFSARATATAPLILGGLGDSINNAWAGKVVLVDRGTITFNEKVRNVQNSGGVACIIANNESGPLDATLGEGNSSVIPAASVNQADGAALKSNLGASTTVSSSIVQSTSSYDFFDGTSMATPHVAGVAALIWSKYRGATNAQVRQALTSSAEDRGGPGRDSDYGFGLVRASAALTALANLGPIAPPVDSTAPVISGVAATTIKGRSGNFQITWRTNEPASSDVQLNTSVSYDPTLSTTHTRTLRGTRGTTNYFYVISRDAAGNVGTAGPFTIPL